MPDNPTRKRLHRREGDHAARFITFSCQGRLPLLADPWVADVFVQDLAALRTKTRFELFAFVVMPEHVHLLVRPPPEARLDRILLSLKLSVAQHVINTWRRASPDRLAQITVCDKSASVSSTDPSHSKHKDHTTARFWLKGGGHDRNVRDLTEFTRHVRYIHRNPVERGLVKECPQWKWSSVRWWMGQRDGEIECDQPPSGRIDWSSWKGFM